MPLDKTVLMQYIEMKAEIKDLEQRISKISKDIDKLMPVSDTVKGTRKDGTIGPIKVSGYPYPRYKRMKTILENRRMRLKQLQVELLQLTSDAEEYINGIQNSEIRIMLRMHYIDGMSYAAVAMNMNNMFPKRKTKYSDENVKKKMNRFLKNL